MNGGSPPGQGVSSTNSIKEIKSLNALRWKTKQAQAFESDIFRASPKTTILLAQDVIYPSSTAIKKRYTTLPYTENHLQLILSQNQHFYELIHDRLPRKLYMDIDISHDSPYFKTKSYIQIRKELITMMNALLNTTFDTTNRSSITHKNTHCFVVQDDSKKQSMHIIFPIYLCNKEDTSYFAHIMKHFLHSTYNNPFLTAVVDFSVYSSNRCFRMPYQSKIDKPDLILTPISSTTSPLLQDHLVGIYNDPTLTQYSYLDTTTLQRVGVEAALALGQKTFHEFDVATMPTHDAKRITHFVRSNFDVFANLRPPSPIQTHPPDRQEDQDDIEYLLSCIPNSAQAPQHFTLWYAIGQTLKNIAHSNPKKDAHLLSLWIKWSNQASTIYGDETNACKRKWQDMSIRPIKRWGVPFLITIAKIYYPDLQIQEVETAHLFKDLFHTEEYHDTFDAIDIYNERYMRPYDLNSYDLQVSVGPLGSGKTTRMEELSEGSRGSLAHANGCAPLTTHSRVLMVGCRQTFCRNKTVEFRNTWPRMRYYKDEQVQKLYDWSVIDQLVVQVESLHRLKFIDTPYDLLILDEIESILYQFSSDTQANPMDCFNAFMTLLLTSKKIIMADAFITNRTMSFIKHIKSLRPQLRIKLDQNNVNNNSHITAHILGIATQPTSVPNVKGTFIARIIESLKQNKKICVVCSSKTLKDMIIDAIKSDTDLAPTFLANSSAAILNYDRDTDDADIDALGDIKGIWGNPTVRLVIYTTKITVGISFDIPNVFHSIFIYGSIYCPIVRDLMQSHFRVRKVSDNEIFVAINSCHVPETTSHAEELTLAYAKTIMQSIKTTFNHLAPLDITTNSLFAHRDFYLSILQYNLLEEKLGYSAYEALFRYFLKKVGYTIKDVDPLADQDNLAINTHQVPDGLFPTGYVTQYVSYRNTNPGDIDEIERRKKTSCATTEDKMICDAFFFYKNIITKTKLFSCINPEEREHLERELVSKMDEETLALFNAKASSLDYTPLEMIECELFNAYRSQKKIQHAMENMVMELCSKTTGIQSYYVSNVTSAIKKQKSVIKLDYITKLCNILGLSNSYDTSKTLTDADMSKFLDYYKTLDQDQKQQIKEFFSVQLRTDKLGIQQATSIISQMLTCWCGCSIKRVKVKTVRGSSSYDYYIQQAPVDLEMFSALIVPS